MCVNGSWQKVCWESGRQDVVRSSRRKRTGASWRLPMGFRLRMRWRVVATCTSFGPRFPRIFSLRRVCASPALFPPSALLLSCHIGIRSRTAPIMLASIPIFSLRSSAVTAAPLAAAMALKIPMPMPIWTAAILCVCSDELHALVSMMVALTLRK